MIEELGYDKTKMNVSSQPVIKTGTNRGYRCIEKNGKWAYISGYDCHNPQAEKYAHISWAKKLISLGFRIGCQYNDGVTNFFIFVKGIK